ncbi:MAG TPA: hypothetical protein VF488_04730, partial [Gemmatimonadaceae bacterium]
MTKLAFPASCAVAAMLAACSSDRPTSAGPGCGPAASLSVRGGTSAITDPGSLGPLQAITINADGLPNCLTLDADSGTYIVVPQFATGSGGRSSASYTLDVSSPSAPAARASFAMRQDAAPPLPVSPQVQLDLTLRGLEHRLAGGAPASLAAWRASADVRRAVSAATLPPIGSTRTFQVLGDLVGTAFTTDTATLRYVGTNVMIYVSQQAPPPPKGFTDTQLATFGQLFDRDLYDIDVRTFGSPSDIDGNGHVIVLLTPKVNELTLSSTCASEGYVSGFFFGVDLTPTAAHSNQGEIFYSMVPDPDSTFSCPHTVADVEFNTPATFIHEFQHMISWNQHVIVRNGPDEETWLNEGLSHIAEEMGSRYYEHKYPAPLGRTNPAQLFPDSAEGFISGDLFNAYSFMLEPARWSITEFLSRGRVEERGGAWLFLRWLGDQKDSTIYAKLDQTVLTGVANVEAQSGEKLPHLYGDFTLALYADSLVGVDRSQLPPRDRFLSRNLRQLFQALYDATSGRRDLVPRPWPLPLTSVNEPGSASSSMLPGTAEFYVVHLPNPAPAAARVLFAP